MAEKSPKKAKTSVDDDEGDDGVNRYTGNVLSDRYYEILTKRKTLPVWLQKQEFIETLRTNQTMISRRRDG